MARLVKISRSNAALETLSYPLSREVEAAELDDMTVELANGEKNLGELVADLGSDTYHSVDDLRDELFEYLPEEALGEVEEAEREG